MGDHTTTLRGINDRIANLLERMTLDEKIGQLSIVSGATDDVSESLRQSVIEGRVGAIINVVERSTADELQRLATTESRLGIPLLFGRDVIHGFKTIFPIPLAQAASWNPCLVERAAHIAATEAASAGINWTFAPMLDVTRDPRWGRIAESFGEDPYLTSVLGAAAIRGFQGNDLTDPSRIAACAKHFAGYGASESGRDYNTTNVPENELRNVHLPPFKAAIEARVVSIMTSFSDLDGIPATANSFLLRKVLRDEWRFEALVTSDWESIGQLSVHGFTADDKESACEAAKAGVDMEMTSTTYVRYLSTLINEGKVSESQVDEMTAHVLAVKFRLGLFDSSRVVKSTSSVGSPPSYLADAKELASQSAVLLSNKNRLLPLDAKELKSIAVIGPLAHDGYEQLGTWVFDGDTELSQTPLDALRAHVNKSTDIQYVRALESTRSGGMNQFNEAIRVAEKSDVAILFLGEESILSGEAHCRADITLPGRQEELISQIAATGTPIVMVIMAGRPLVLSNVIDKVDALFYAWHGGNMAGPATIDLIFGKESPSGKLPVTFPRLIGQIPIYYAHKNTGRPPTEDTVIRIDDIERAAPQHSIGNTSFHLDTDYTPQFPFGYGLSYTEFKYSNIKMSSEKIGMGEHFVVSADLANAGDVEATEVVQLYIRDLVGSVTRPVKQLKGFKRLRLKPGESITVSFELNTDDLAFYGREQTLVTEPGKFHAWIGGSSETDLRVEFEITDHP